MAQKEQKMTRIEKGVQQVERWDKIVLENGIVGYMYQPYVTEKIPEPEIPPELEDPDVWEDVEIYFNSPLVVNEREITGIDYKKNKVSDLKSLITTNAEIEIVSNKNEVLGDGDAVGTGYKIRVKQNEKILRQYTIIIYGDVNGDTKINSVDLLILQRHILELRLISGTYLKAANVRKTGTKPTSVDLLIIQRHILDLKQIEQ